MFVTFKRKKHSIGCQMTSLTSLLLITFLITLIDAQLDEPNTESDSRTIGDTSKRAGFLPSRGRRFWSIFDWRDNSGEKRMARFLPMRGRKAGFLPSRGKKWSPEISDDYSYGRPINSYENYFDIKSEDSPIIPNGNNELTLRGKKAFHAMRGKKESASDSYLTGDMFKKSMNFFGMRG